MGKGTAVKNPAGEGDSTLKVMIEKSLPRRPIKGLWRKGLRDMEKGKDPPFYPMCTLCYLPVIIPSLFKALSFT